MLKLSYMAGLEYFEVQGSVSEVARAYAGLPQRRRSPIPGRDEDAGEYVRLVELEGPEEERSAMFREVERLRSARRAALEQATQSGDLNAIFAALFAY